MRFVAWVGMVLALLLTAQAAQAEIVITVDKTAQELTVRVNGATRYSWPVSTARWGYNTPNGTYRPQRLERKWFSRKYDWSPMPYSIFFAGGYAIHGSYEIAHLGRPASHGCIRLHPENAAVLFNLVKENRDETRIEVVGERPAPTNSSRRANAEENGRPSSRRQRAEERRVQRASQPSRGFEDLFNK